MVPVLGVGVTGAGTAYSGEIVIELDLSADFDGRSNDSALPFAADIFSFGDGINNAIYRLELEETGDNTATFVGSVEYRMLNQLNHDQSTTYIDLETISDTIDIIVHEDLTDEEISLFGVWGTSGDNIYICGSHGTILNFDGTDWKPMESGTEEYLLSIWGASSEDIYAVGDNAAMLHYDGKKWSPIEPPKDEYYTKVKGLGPDQVYVAGENGTVIKYNGKEWSDMSL